MSTYYRQFAVCTAGQWPHLPLFSVKHGLFRNTGDGQATPGVPDTTSEARPTSGRAEAGIIRRGA